MGTITTTRPVLGDELVITTQNGSETVRRNVQTAFGLGSSAVQTTTSFRTGGRIVGELHDEDLELLSSKDYQDVRKALYSQELRSRKSKWDNGHPFSTEKRYVTDYGMYVSDNNFGGIQYHYEGPIWPINPSGVNRFQFLPPFDGTFYGTRAIARTAPTAPSMSLLGALIELKREGLPALPGLTALANKSVRDIGSEFLNVEFGYKPLADDLARLASTTSDSYKLLKQYVRDSDQQIRRSFTFPVEKTSEFFPGISTQTALVGSTGIKPWTTNGGTQLAQVSGTLTRTKTTERRVWFRGAYVYSLPISDSKMAHFKTLMLKFQRLYGIEITAELLWNVSPWTWLADWNANMGDVLSNLTYLGTDNLVLRYGYVMCHSVTRHNYTFTVTNPGQYKRGPLGAFTCTFVVERKERVRARPYGFALNPTSYTGKQWAILGALGLTKAPSTLP